MYKGPILRYCTFIFSLSQCVDILIIYDQYIPYCSCFKCVLCVCFVAVVVFGFSLGTSFVFSAAFVLWCFLVCDQGGWALVAEQIAYAAGAARSILMDRHLDPEGMKDDDRCGTVRCSTLDSVAELRNDFWETAI